MAKGVPAHKQEGGPSAEEKVAEEESKRRRELALSRGLLARHKANPALPLRPTKAILKCDGKDIVKKGHRKNKYLFSFPGLVAPVAGGKFGELTHLDSRNPILYVEFPQGRLKLFGTIVYPKNKYLTLHFLRGAGNIVCEDCFESLVVFSVAWWIGTKDENPEELRLPLPQELQQEKHADFDFTAGAGLARDPKENIEGEKLFREKDAPESPKGQLKMEKWLVRKKQGGDDTKSAVPSQEKEPDSEDEEKHLIVKEDAPTPLRQSARTAGQKFKYTESSSHEDDEAESGSASDSSRSKHEKQGAGGGAVSKTFPTYEDDSCLVPAEQATKNGASALTGISTGKSDAATCGLVKLISDEETKGGDSLAAAKNGLVVQNDSSAKRSLGGALNTSAIEVAAPTSTPAGGFKQSSLATFLLKPREKSHQVEVESAEQSPTKVKAEAAGKSITGSKRQYTRKNVTMTKSSVDGDEGNIHNRETEEVSHSSKEVVHTPKSRKAPTPRKPLSESTGSQKRRKVSTPKGKEGTGRKGSRQERKKKCWPGVLGYMKSQ